MKVRVKSKDVNLRIPVPMGMAAFVIKVIPETVFIQMRKEVPQPYDMLLTREVLGMLLNECMESFKENKGLEIVHVEAADGTFVSITI